MTDDNTTPEEVTPNQEPEGTLGAEAAEAINTDSPKAALAKELTSEQLDQVERAISQALDGAQRKWAEKDEKRIAEKGYLTPEQAKAIAQEQVQVAEERTKAEANVSIWLRDNGVDPASDEAKKVLAEYRDGLESGRYTNKMLLDPKGVGFLVHAAGVAPAKDPEPDYELPRTSMPVPMKSATGEDGKPLSRQERDAKIREANIAAIQSFQSQRR